MPVVEKSSNDLLLEVFLQNILIVILYRIKRPLIPNCLLLNLDNDNFDYICLFYNLIIIAELFIRIISYNHVLNYSKLSRY